MQATRRGGTRDVLALLEPEEVAIELPLFAVGGQEQACSPWREGGGRVPGLQTGAAATHLGLEEGRDSPFDGPIPDAPLKNRCLLPFAHADYVVQRKAEAFYYFNLAFVILLGAGLVFYIAAAPQRLFLAEPAFIIGMGTGVANLYLLSRGRFAFAAALTSILTALVLAVGQLCKLEGDYHTAYTSFGYLFLLPALIAGLFSARPLILGLSAVMLAVNILFYALTFRIDGLGREVRESLNMGFCSSTLILALGAVLLYRLRLIMDRAHADLVANNLSMERFVPFDFMQALGKTSVPELNLGDHTRQTMTVMFCDLRDFTALSERSEDADTFALLNRYFGAMVPVIREHRGFVDKYIGDAMLAVFNAPADAVAAALAMRDALVAFNRETGSALDFGIGMDSGMISMGMIGERSRIEGTVISDIVNTAHRIERLTKELGHRILLSGNTAGLLGEGFRIRFLQSANVRGRAQAVSIHTVDP